MKLITAALVFACALILTASASAVEFGANDDRGRYAADGGAAFFGQMASAGLKQNVMTVRFLPSAPLTIPGKEYLDVAVPTAVAAGVAPVFAVYPYPPSDIQAGAASPVAFAAWLDALARTYPQVRTFIVGNEPNLNSFWRPQGNGKGRIVAAASFGRFLAAGYDALKTVSPGITVLGIGLSPRGDDAPRAAGKTSPVHFLSALGAWYRASGRRKPLMDGLSYHPYPNPSNFRVPFSFAYGWPSASVQELGRIKQAVWDAFHGTAQRTTKNGLRLYLDEVGWQVDTSALRGYSGAENVAVTSEASQAAIYAELVRYVACDPDIAQVNFFGYYDELDRGGWQSALRRADGSARAANTAVRKAIAATGGRCRRRAALVATRPRRRRRGRVVRLPVEAVGPDAPRLGFPGDRARGCDLPRRHLRERHEAGRDGAEARGRDRGGAQGVGHHQVPLRAVDLVPGRTARTRLVRVRDPDAGEAERRTRHCIRVEAVSGRKGIDTAVSLRPLTANMCSCIMANTCSVVFFFSSRSRSSSGPHSHARRMPPVLTSATSCSRPTPSGRSRPGGTPIRGKASTSSGSGTGSRARRSCPGRCSCCRSRPHQT